MQSFLLLTLHKKSLLLVHYQIRSNQKQTNITFKKQNGKSNHLSNTWSDIPKISFFNFQQKLAKDEEVEVDVTKEDQKLINSFGKLHNKTKDLEREKKFIQVRNNKSHHPSEYIWKSSNPH